MPKVEIGFEHCNVVADVQVGSRSLPSLWNYTLDNLEVRT